MNETLANWSFVSYFLSVAAEYAATDKKYETNDQFARVSFNIASAYPKEAGIRKWIRTVTLDRVGHRVVIEEDFELNSATQEVALSVMTPCETSSTGFGAISLRTAQGSFAQLLFENAEIQSTVGIVEIDDPHLREDWGPQIYRILLYGYPGSSGKWTYEFSAGSNSLQMK